nr:NigD-like C-terminal domain-containing protein [uncultured Bacteroides sp.]
MIRGKYCWLLFTLLVFLLTSCGDDDYHYPSVKLEFLTAFSGSDGSLQSVLTDEGEQYPVLENASKLTIDPNSFVRIVSNYEPVKAADGVAGVKLYAALGTISPFPLPADKFEDGVKTDPVELQSIWMGIDYLNLLLGIKAQDGKHLLHFIEDEVVKDKSTGLVNVHLTLYHDAANDVLAYTKRAYVSVPLWQYAEEGVKKVAVTMDINTYSGETKTYQFEYLPKN